MTIKEALVKVVGNLDGIKIPVSEIKAIGVAVSNSVDILRQCIQFMEQAEQAEQPPEKDGDNDGGN